MSKDVTTANPSKREFLKKAAYVVPAVLTLKAAPAFASAGSGYKNGKKHGKDHKKDYNKNNKSRYSGRREDD